MSLLVREYLSIHSTHNAKYLFHLVFIEFFAGALFSKFSLTVFCFFQGFRPFFSNSTQFTAPEVTMKVDTFNTYFAANVKTDERVKYF